MAIKYGTSDVTAIKYGTNDVQKVVYNGVEVWSAPPAGEYCEVTGLGNSNPNAVRFSKSEGFDNIVLERITFDGDTFIKFPTMYRKINSTSSGQITSFTISTAALDESYKVYPCFLKEDGSTIMPYVYIGVSCSNSSTTCNSVDGYTSYMSQAIGTGRTNARNRGPGYQLLDLHLLKLWQDMLICRMGTINTNSGAGIRTDIFGLYWGNINILIDGIAYLSNSSSYVVSYTPSNYTNSPSASTTSYSRLSYTIPYNTYNQEIKILGYDNSNEFCNLPTTTISNTSFNTYYCDAVKTASSGVTATMKINVGGEYPDVGAFYTVIDEYFGSSGAIRLCYRPIND